MKAEYLDFGRWLRGQQHRDDAVGVAARALRDSGVAVRGAYRLRLIKLGGYGWLLKDGGPLEQALVEWRLTT